VLSDSYDPLLVAAIRNRPRTEDQVTRIHTAVREGLAAIYAADREALRVRTRLTPRTPALRARLGDNQFATQVLATLTTALEEWVAADGAAELPALIDEAFRPLNEGQQP
jgi:hypothetical protein